MATSTHRPIVVGVDGSPSSLAAAHLAADLAVRRAAPLHLVCGYQVPMYGYLPVGIVDRYAIDDVRAREDLHQRLAATAKQIRADHPALADVRTHVLSGTAAAVVIEASRTAAATVVGCRGIGGFAGLLLGSVSAQVSAHGYGPVIVVRPPIPDRPTGHEQPPYEPPAGPVVVGVDRSPASKAAIRFAADEARWRGVPLMAVHAYRDEGGETDTVLAENLLANRILPASRAYPDLDVELRAVEVPDIETAMIEASRGAGLVVVGCRGVGGFAGLLLGSVSRALVHHAYAPVAVIHPSSEQ